MGQLPPLKSRSTLSNPKKLTPLNSTVQLHLCPPLMISELMLAILEKEKAHKFNLQNENLICSSFTHSFPSSLAAVSRSNSYGGNLKRRRITSLFPHWRSINLLCAADDCVGIGSFLRRHRRRPSWIAGSRSKFCLFSIYFSLFFKNLFGASSFSLLALRIWRRWIGFVGVEICWYMNCSWFFLLDLDEDDLGFNLFDLVQPFQFLKNLVWSIFFFC